MPSFCARITKEIACQSATMGIRLPFRRSAAAAASIHYAEAARGQPMQRAQHIAPENKSEAQRREDVWRHFVTFAHFQMNKQFITGNNCGKMERFRELSGAWGQSFSPEKLMKQLK